MKLRIRRWPMAIVFSLLAIVFVWEATYGQPRGMQPRPGRQQSPGQQGQGRNREPEPPTLPSDERLLAFHRDFVKNAEKLALEYEGKKEYDKALACYQEILRVIPQYAPAQRKVEEFSQRFATANKGTFEVQANKPWQDTGVRVVAGKPIAIRASGTWTFTHTSRTTAEGIPIPEELRDFNLGCLVGVIDTGDPNDYRPFVIGAGTQFTAEKAGKLLVRMYDVDPADNEGSLKMEFLGTFDQK